MYGATKAAVSQFAASLAVECRAKGVDICAVHPSPVASNFFANLDHKIDAPEMAKKTAVGPDSLPPMILPAPGRFIIRDMGGMALGVRAGIACLPYNALTMLFAVGAPFMPDYKVRHRVVWRVVSRCFPAHHVLLSPPHRAEAQRLGAWWWLLWARAGAAGSGVRRAWRFIKCPKTAGGRFVR